MRTSGGKGDVWQAQILACRYYIALPPSDTGKEILFERCKQQEIRSKREVRLPFWKPTEHVAPSRSIMKRVRKGLGARSSRAIPAGGSSLMHKVPSREHLRTESLSPELSSDM